MYVSDHQKGDLSDIIHSASRTTQSETDDGWNISEDSQAYFQQLQTHDFDTASNNIHDSLLYSGDRIQVDQNSLLHGGDQIQVDQNSLLHTGDRIQVAQNSLLLTGDQIQIDQNSLLHSGDQRQVDQNSLLPTGDPIQVVQNSLLHSGDQIQVDQNMLHIGDEIVRSSETPDNIFSRVLHVLPVKQSSMVLGNGAHVSSPYIPGIKRRKSLPRKVVCVPAPGNTTSNGRVSSGEVVPCDLWAWRKYGQKPIKGSPYPRGYYRCSSSKGCAARKQVERSRTDPNMLVITYTCEHNHPWPTQRNALAGSTRSSYPSKQQKPTTSNSNLKDMNRTSTSSSNLTVVKKEASEVLHGANSVLYDTFIENDDLFADLEGLGSGPMSLLLEKPEEKNSGENLKHLDAFDDMFDWGQSSFFGPSTQ